MEINIKTTTSYMLCERFALALARVCDAGRLAGVRWAHSRIGITLVIGFSLAGCAGQMAYREGRSLAARGNVSEAALKFQAAVEADPESIEFRAALMRARERALQNQLDLADKAATTGRAEAAELYHRVLETWPGNERARAGLEAIDRSERHSKLITEAKVAQARGDLREMDAKLATVLAEDPRHPAALALRRPTETHADLVPVPSAELAAAYKKPISIDFKDVTLKQIFEVLSRASGLNILFDKDVRTDQKTSIFLKNSNVETVLLFVEQTNKLNHQVLDGNTILVYANTPDKQKEYQELIVKTFFLTNADAKTVGATLKAMLKSRDMVVDDRLNMIILRDSIDAVRLAEKLVALHDVPEPEVMLEVEVLEVKRTRLMELGTRWPNGLSLTPLAASGGGTLTVNDLRDVNSRTLGVGGPPVVTINARAQDGDTNILANPRIRARNREKAKILIGERVPNITTTTSSTGFAGESITYIDVGLKLEVEPTIYLDNDVAIRVSLEVSSIGKEIQTRSGSLAYQIGTRTASTVLRLKDGENQILAGLINDEDRTSRYKVPGFGEMPVLGRLFGSSLDDAQKTEIVLSITPRLIRNIRRPDSAQGEFRSGTDTDFRIRSQPVTLPAIPAPSAAPHSSPATSGGATAPFPGQTSVPAVPGSAMPATSVPPAVPPNAVSQPGISGVTPLTSRPGADALPAQSPLPISVTPAGSGQSNEDNNVQPAKSGGASPGSAAAGGASK